MERKTKRDTSKAVEAIRKGRLQRERLGILPAEFMRLTLTEDAFKVVQGMGNLEFRKFVSTAIRRAAKRR